MNKLMGGAKIRALPTDGIPFSGAARDHPEGLEGGELEIESW